MTNQLNIGLIGAGRIGRIHAEVLAYRVPSANLMMVADVFEESARTCAADFQIPIVASSPQAIFESSEIDAVAICSSTKTHAQFIIEAAQAGKHIFCEKPIALDLASIDQALAEVEKAGVKLQVGFNRRFHPNFKQVRDLVAAGKLGTPHMVRISSRDSAPPPPGYVEVSGGIFLDMTIHDFDMARYLIGDEIEEVYATGGVMVDPTIGEAGDIDTTVIVLTYKSGAICTIDNSREAVFGYDQRVEVFGSAGMAVSNNNTPHNTMHYTRESGYTPLPHWGFLELYFDTYVAEMQAFVEAILNDIEPLVTGLDGRYPLLIGLAAGKSLRERRPVKLSEIEV